MLHEPNSTLGDETAMTEHYTPGHTLESADFMARRSLNSHGAFILPLLTETSSVIDCGAGPGTITCDIAERTRRGSVVGIDADESEVRSATKLAVLRRLDNVRFRQASVYDLSNVAGEFDVAFAHGLLEHLAEPDRAVSEIRRALRPGGILGVCSPDWGGFIVAPNTDAVVTAMETYMAIQVRNGGDPMMGRKLGQLLERAGFRDIQMDARYEVYETTGPIANYLALQLRREGEDVHAKELVDWASNPVGMFAQAWISCTGTNPSP
jgi:SAM-dependent methyltransferase